jgi:hypothetical protein
MFAKVYETEKYGQILAKIDSAEPEDKSGAEVRFYFQPKGVVGLFSVARFFPDTDDGWDNSDKFFLELDKEKCEKIVDPSFELVANFAGQG